MCKNWTNNIGPASAQFWPSVAFSSSYREPGINHHVPSDIDVLTPKLTRPSARAMIITKLDMVYPSPISPQWICFRCSKGIIRNSQRDFYLSFWRHFNPSGTEVGVDGEHYVNAMVADDPAPCVARPSATMVMTTKDARFLVSRQNGFQLTVPPQY